MCCNSLRENPGYITTSPVYWEAKLCCCVSVFHLEQLTSLTSPAVPGPPDLGLFVKPTPLQQINYREKLIF